MADDISPDPTPTDPTTTKGVAGTAVYGGYIEVKERHSELVGSEKYRTFSNILANTAIVAAGARAYLNLASKPDWYCEAPVNSGNEGRRIASLISGMMHEMRTPWHRVVRRALLYRFYGFSIQEWTAVRREDGLIGMLDCQSRPQSTIEKWDTEPDGTVLGVIQNSPQDSREIYLPRWKLLYAVDDSLTDSPEGLGLLRQIAEPHRRLKRYEQLEGWGFETDLRGIPIGRAPLSKLAEQLKNGTIDQVEYDARVAAVTKFIEKHIKGPNLGIMLDSLTYETTDDATRPSGVKQFDIELLKAGATSQPEILRAIDRVVREIALVLGVEHLLLGANGVGSFAMSKDKSSNFALVVDSALKDLIEVVRNDWVGPIMRLNGWDMKYRPTVKCDKIQYRAVEEVTGALRDMAQAGGVMRPDDPAINAVRDLIGVPHQPEMSADDLAALTGTPDPETMTTPQEGT